jgi:hypothetical protein
VGRSSVSIGAARYYKGKVIDNKKLVTRRQRKELVSLRQCVSESSSVSVRNQNSTVLNVNYRRQKPVFRRVAVISGVRSLSLYLVVSCCISSQ